MKKTGQLSSYLVFLLLSCDQGQAVCLQQSPVEVTLCPLGGWGSGQGLHDGIDVHPRDVGIK